MIDIEGGNNLLTCRLIKFWSLKRKMTITDQLLGSDNQNSLIEKIQRNRDSFSNRKRDLYNE